MYRCYHPIYGIKQNCLIRSKRLLNLSTNNNVYSNLRLQLIVMNEPIVLKGPMILLKIGYFFGFYCYIINYNLVRS